MTPNNHWYTIDNSGMATLCVDEQDARNSAIEYAELYPKRAPYVVGRLAPMTANNNERVISFVDELAQEIRRVDGNHDKGAAALAEALMPFLRNHCQPAMPADADPLKLIEEQIKNPLSHYSRLVRHLRIIAGTTLMEMSKSTGYTPSYLSGVEFGRKPLTPELIRATQLFFNDKGLGVSQYLLQQAADARRRIEGE